MYIDPHVHLRDGEQNYKETIAHGLVVAKNQGVGFVFDMPNTLNPILTREDVLKRLKLVSKNEKHRYFLYIGATTDEKQLKNAIELVKKRREVIGIKLFAGQSTGNLAIISQADQQKIYQILANNKYNGVLAVHCEKEEFLKNKFNPARPYTHALSRPKKAEIESIKDQIRFASETGFDGVLHICHVSCAQSIKIIEQARKKIKITCGVTPHHLMWNDNKLRDDHGLLYKMNPPLRTKKNVLALQKYLCEGKIDWIETDHAPHTIGEKLYDGFPSGYPSLYLYKECVEKFLPKIGLDKKRIKDVTYNNIIQIFNLKI